jgi:hypothetical protein
LTASATYMKLIRAKKRLPKDSEYPILIVYLFDQLVEVEWNSLRIWANQDYIRDDMYWVPLRKVWK